MNDYLKEKLKRIPHNPGSYQMLDKNGEVIYVGKAKDLNRRVNSYFRGAHDLKTSLLVQNINDFNYIVTNKEKEAFLLEINLIKKYNPKYNILLKDDKSYPYIEFITLKGPLLRVVRPKNKDKKGSYFFGPYPSVKAARSVVLALNRIYPLRKCDPLRKDYCLYFHIGECLGYCKRNIEREEIEKINEEIIDFFKGKNNSLINELKKKRDDYSLKLEFEEASKINDLIKDMEVVLNKQLVDLDSHYNFDLFNTSTKNNYLGIVIFIVRGGKLIGTLKDIVEINSSVEESLENYIVDFYEKNKLVVPLVLVPSYLDTLLLQSVLEVEVRSPKIGKLKKLFDLAENNSLIYLNEELEKKISKDKNKREAQEELNNIFKQDIKRIEAFDTSHLFGTFYVGGMVVFDYLEKNKNEYRKYKIKSGAHDDLSALKEVFLRRYTRVVIDDLKRPDLIIVDGGENQVKVLKEVLDDLNLKINILGLKKDKHHRTNILIKEDLEEINLPKDSKLFLALEKVQDEVHRYAITYHRSLKEKGDFSNLLDGVKGLGEVRKNKLLKKYKSLDKIKKASDEELEKILPLKVVNNLKEILK